MHVAVSAASSTCDSPKPKNQGKLVIDFLNADFFNKHHLLALTTRKGKVCQKERNLFLNETKIKEIGHVIQVYLPGEMKQLYVATVYMIGGIPRTNFFKNPARRRQGLLAMI